MSAKRVLLVFGKMNRGGAETLAMNIFRCVDREKITFDFLVHTNEKCDYDNEITALGGKIYHFPRYNGKNHFTYTKMWNEFLSNHPEYKVVHAHIYGPTSVFLPICKKFGIYTVAHSHTCSPEVGLRQKIVDLYTVPVRNMADYLFACSQNSGEWMFGKNVAKRSNYQVLKNGIILDDFKFNQQWRDEIRNEFGIQNRFVIVNVSRFHVQKNHIFLIEAFAKIKQQNDNTVLLLVGDGAERENIQNKINALGVGDSVIFAGVRSDVNKILSAADVFVMTSLFEGLPVSLVEAQASGIPCVVADTVSKEVAITDLIEFCSLNRGADHWADTVLKYANQNQRPDTTQQITDAGYNMKATALKLQDFYLEKIK